MNKVNLSANGNARSHRIKNALEHQHERVQRRIINQVQHGELCMIERHKSLEVETAQTLIDMKLARINMDAPKFFTLERTGTINFKPKVKIKKEWMHMV